jgi:hypothetical protein
MNQLLDQKQLLEFSIIVDEAIHKAASKTSLNSDGLQRVLSRKGVIFDFFDKLFSENQGMRPASILTLLSAGKTPTLEALDGKKYIGGAKKVFKSHIDSNFEDWKLNEPGKATGKVHVQAYELNMDVTFAQIFSSLASDLDKLCLSQHQIIQFCKKYPDRLNQNEHATFFLFKKIGEYLVADVRVSPKGLTAYVYCFDREVVCYSKDRLRFVVPQL